MISLESVKKTGFKNYFRNTLWLFLTYGLRLFTGFFVGLWLARYLGPTEYGIYNYVISFTTIIITIASFGTTEIIVKKILDSNVKVEESLKSGFDLRLCLSILLFIIFCLYVYFFEQSKDVQKYMFISALALFFQPFEVVDSFFRAKVQAKKSSIGRMSQLVVSSLAKIFLIIYQAPLEWFYFVFVCDAVFYSAIVLISYLKDNDNFFRKKASSSLTKAILKESFPLMIIAVSALMLSRFDLVIIGYFLTKTDVGFYSAASKTIEIGTLFSVIISLSLYPAILNSKKSDKDLYLKRMAMLNRLLVWGGLALTVSVFFLAETIIQILFGNQFEASVDILRILSLNILFVSFYQVSFRWYLSENLQSLMMYKTVWAVILNIVLNVILIPRFGITGAALGSVSISFLFHFVFEAFHPRTRECFRINTSFLRF